MSALWYNFCVNKKAILAILILFLLSGLGMIYMLLRVGEGEAIPQEGEVVVVDEEQYEEQIVVDVDTPTHVEYEIKEFARDLYVPWSIDWTSNSRMLVTERNGNVREIVDGVLNPNPVHIFSEVSTESEEGLMGMVVDPHYGLNRYVYFCLAYPEDGVIYDKVVRVVDDGTSMTVDKVLLDKIPAARFHAGCRIKFGPDEKLYITTGDASDKKIAQKRDSLGGKILRINSDGTRPDDNPFRDSLIWSLGHRNSQGIDWHHSGVMWSSEHGPSGFDGPGGGDEINVIKKGANYGWPLVSHEGSRKDSEDPKLVFSPAFPPGSATFYNADVIPQFKNNLFVGGLASEAILRVTVSEIDPEEPVAYERLPDINYGRIREIAVGPDGVLYFATSNRDGRGALKEGDDKIFKLAPQAN